MASKVLRYNVGGRVETDKWRARVKMDWTEYYLGYFDNQEDALSAEKEFRAKHNR